MENWPKAALDVIEKLTPKFRAIIHRFGMDQEAEDIIAEASIKIGTRWDTCTSKPEPWATSVLVNLLRHAYRHRKKVTLHKSIVWQDNLVPEPEMHYLDTLLAVGRLLSCLADRQLELVDLLFWEGLTHEEAAARMGLKYGAVRALLHRAMKRLKREVLRPGNEDLADLADLEECRADWLRRAARTGLPRSRRRRPVLPFPARAPAAAPSQPA